MATLDRCDKEIAACQAVFDDQASSETDRLGATIGDADWRSERQRVEEEMQLESA